MRKTILAVAVLIVAPTFAQEVEHAPTAAQCEADQKLWLSQYREWLGASDKSKTVVNTLSIDEILRRITEMAACIDVVFDPNGPSSVIDPYTQTSGDYANVADNRYVHFITRHHLWQQIEAEDAAGQR